MANDYWLYLNRHAGPHQAVLHRSICRHCRHGQGQHGQGARAVASALGATAWGCKVCRPDTTGRRC